MKPNGVYGGRQPYPIATELGELENGRTVRSNTYDDPQQLFTPTPMYETVVSAKKEMLNASGPRVLNPVYGPTGTPTTPISPNIPNVTLQATPVLNPIYSETQVSQLNPVYAAIATTPVQPAPRHANTHNNHVPANASDSFKRVDSESCPQLPMYEELHAVKPCSKGQGGVEDNMTKNESYGLLMNNS